ncbi:hypothetical protein J2X01_001229 [Arthrobacter ginsengisoli]|uniref:Uncharacterized protein n=1 Tax=Arthrobacter ginsengisoli TaxID=1356565 RepID=A0ABU1U9R7_9MICC|nr:hypothetical protein [Arthrobacter ginsengisoli]MDR7081944.1 hypothetical protein [Arthrobacter ginsengisoli]
MPSLFESVPFPPVQLLALAAVVACAAGSCVYLLRKHLADDDGLPDAVFWDGFAGFAIIAPAIILPALVAPWAGLFLGVVAAGAAAASYLWTPRVFSWQADRRFSKETAASHEEAAARHRSALARWQRYELDPAHSIDYPAMSDPRQPETAAMIRAMKAAERLRGGTEAGYAPAVDQLERALADAERAAGVGREAPTRPAGFPALG